MSGQVAQCVGVYTPDANDDTSDYSHSGHRPVSHTKVIPADPPEEQDASGAPNLVVGEDLPKFFPDIPDILKHRVQAL